MVGLVVVGCYGGGGGKVLNKEIEQFGSVSTRSHDYLNLERISFCLCHPWHAWHTTTTLLPSFTRRGLFFPLTALNDTSDQLRQMTTITKGPNDIRRVVWALCRWVFFFLSFFWLLTNVLLIFQVLHMTYQWKNEQQQQNRPKQRIWHRLGLFCRCCLFSCPYFICK